jgi:spore coat polysaccharide biosynthesis protein SpsF
MRVVATIEARMSSSRLPGKVLMPAAGRPMLAHRVERLEAVPSLDAIMLATTVAHADDVLVDFAAEHGIGCHRGSEDDVMQRVVDAARAGEADVIVEITGDCPIVDPAIVEQCIRMFHANGRDYCSNNTPHSWPVGMDTQVFALATLERSAAMTDDPLDREHVSRHMRMNPDLFSQVLLVAPAAEHWPELGLTLDEQGDYELLRNLIEHFADSDPLFPVRDALRVLREEHPEWLELNATVGRKGLHA